ncbi:glycoside hydrolase family 27 protein [Paenibacillus solisilvae]|uniref:Alpha-galactosidase n=1 Tax=Paenibacillus solisilvae TaxID=2486751 RepID=A0ABW0VZZ0_9BACL
MARLRRLSPRPPLGWNSFDCYGCAASEDALLRNAEVMAERLKPAGYEYFVVDNGWFAEYAIAPGSRYPIVRHAEDVNLDRYGRYQPSRCYFPVGLGRLIDRVHGLGLKFGLHLMRGIPRKAVAQNLPILGTSYRASDIADVEDTCTWCPYNYGVNMDHPGAQAYYDGLIAMLAGWGVDFIKADDITGYPREIEAIAKAIEKSGRPMLLSLSPGGQTSPQYMTSYKKANMLRTTRDIWDNRADLDKAFEAWNAFGAFGGDGFWTDLDMIPFGHLQLWKPRNDGKSLEDTPAEEELNGKGHERMSGLTGTQKHTFMTIRALAASPLFMGGDLPTSDDLSFALLTNRDMLACNQNGIVGTRVYQREELEAWRTPHRSVDGEGWIGIFNRGASERQVRLTLEELGLQSSRQMTGFKFRSIWQDPPDYQVRDNVLTASIDGDGVLFIHYYNNDRS